MLFDRYSISIFLAAFLLQYGKPDSIQLKDVMFT